MYYHIISFCIHHKCKHKKHVFPCTTWTLKSLYNAGHKLKHFWSQIVPGHKSKNYVVTNRAAVTNWSESQIVPSHSCLCLHLKINKYSKSESKFPMWRQCWNGGVWWGCSIMLGVKDLMWPRVFRRSNVGLVTYINWLNAVLPVLCEWNMQRVSNAVTCGVLTHEKRLHELTYQLLTGWMAIVISTKYQPAVYNIQWHHGNRWEQKAHHEPWDKYISLESNDSSDVYLSQGSYMGYLYGLLSLRPDIACYSDDFNELFNSANR